MTPNRHTTQGGVDGGREDRRCFGLDGRERRKDRAPANPRAGRCLHRRFPGLSGTGVEFRTAWTVNALPAGVDAGVKAGFT